MNDYSKIVDHLLTRLVGFFTEIMRRYLPDPFVLAILLTLITMILAVVVQGSTPAAVLVDWGKGFWNLLAFTTQVVVILAMGYVLARAPLVDRGLDRAVAAVRTPAGAIVMATIVGGLASYLNWGFGLVLGGIVARKLATHIKGIHYPLIIASSYSSFALYGLGLSSTIPILISTRGHALEAQMGVIPLSQTIFAPPMLIAGLVILATMPVLNILLMPKSPEGVVEMDPAVVEQDAAMPRPQALPPGTPLAHRLNDSRVLSAVIGVLALVYVVIYFVQGKSFDINIINFVILFSGVVLLQTPARYVATLNEGIKAVSGIVLLYPFYAGLMTIMSGSGLVNTISRAFVGTASTTTLSTLGILSSYVINFVAPSAGGHWVIQGPFMSRPRKTLARR